jgi:threonine aldolase
MEKEIVRRGFASDNNGGIHAEILKEIVTANEGHVTGYGSDIYTKRALSLFKEHLGSDKIGRAHV